MTKEIAHNLNATLPVSSIARCVLWRSVPSQSIALWQGRIASCLQGSKWAARFALLIISLTCGFDSRKAYAKTLEDNPGFTPSFTHDIRPLLSDKCFHCHGPDEADRPTDLRLDTQAGVLKAFAGGDFDRSPAWKRIQSADPDEVMPPPEAHKSFTADELSVLKEWMEGGASWSPHWAFVPPKRRAIPTKYGDHPVDAFVRRKLASVELAPRPRATKEKRLRRAKLDLHGLPPTPEELDAFLLDDKPDAWGRVLDRLLSSPRYGERMAVAWLDGARYADTNGYQNDFGRTMWPWRDWVIDSYNRNQPFDQFAIEQLAGDLLPNPTKKQRLATAFNRNNRTVTEAGSIPEEWLVENIVDRVETTSHVFLGLTMGCARCHDHRFDPISQKEFYEFYAFFHSVDEIGVYNEVRGNVGPIVVCPNDKMRARLKELEGDVAQAEQQLKTIMPEVHNAARAWHSNTAAPAPVYASSSVRLDRESFAGVIDGERITDPKEGVSKPSIASAFLGSVANFSGSQRLEYDHLGLPESKQPLTISAWVKRRAGGAIFSKMHDSKAYQGIDGILVEQGRLAIHMISHWPDNAIKVVTENAVPKNQWTLVTVIYDGSKKASGLSVYFGEERQELTTEHDSLSGSLQTDQPVRVGSRSSGGGFNGLIGRFRVFHRELKVAEIRQLIKRDLLTAPASAIDVSKKKDSQNEGSDSGEKLFEINEDWLTQFASLKTAELTRRYNKARIALVSARQELKGYRESIPTCMVMKELPEPRPTYVLERGEYDKPDKSRPVKPDVPSFLGSLPSDRQDRLGLAEWIVSRDNPLTARVAVNRLWGQLFGTGIVKSEENFGVQSDPPSHPELLDWLAVEFMDSGWDVKYLLRLIMSSETYQQSSYATPELYASDPENRLLARGPRRRLDAEFVRDNALSVSGLLNGQIGGPPVRPYQPEGLWKELAGAASDGPYSLSDGEDIYRRTLYTIRKRTVPHPVMSTFDAPSFEICTVKRSTTNTPLQALALLNDLTYVEAAKHLGERMLREAGDDDASRIQYGFRLATSRSPAAEEVDLLHEALGKYRKRYRGDSEAVDLLLTNGQSAVDDSLPPVELAAYASLASLLLNLDETITVE